MTLQPISLRDLALTLLGGVVFALGLQVVFANFLPPFEPVWADELTGVEVVRGDRLSEAQVVLLSELELVGEAEEVLWGLAYEWPRMRRAIVCTSRRLVEYARLGPVSEIRLTAAGRASGRHVEVAGEYYLRLRKLDPPR